MVARHGLGPRGYKSCKIIIEVCIVDISLAFLEYVEQFCCVYSEYTYSYLAGIYYYVFPSEKYLINLLSKKNL